MSSTFSTPSIFSEHSPSSVLIVDDDYQDVLRVRRYLREAGVRGAVVNLGDVDMAFVYLAECLIRRVGLPQLIVLDIPKKGGGFELIDWICLQPTLQKALIVVLCSSTDDRDVRRAAALGARSFSPRTPQVRVIQSAYQLASAMCRIDELDRTLNSAGLRRRLRGPDDHQMPASA